MSAERDLRALLVERAGAGPEQPADRLAATYRLATRMRRRRRATAAGVAACLLALVLGGVAVLTRPATRDPAQPGGTTSGPRHTATEADRREVVRQVPELLHGGRLVLRNDFGGGGLATTVQPLVDLPAGDYFAAFSCIGKSTLVARADGRELFRSDCTGGRTELRWPSWQRSQQAATLGLNGHNRPSFEIATANGASSSSVASLGIYQVLPAGTFPLPKRPARVAAPVRPSGFGDGPAVLPGGTASAGPRVTLDWNTVAALTCTGPGQFTVLADEVAVAEIGCWDYAGTTAETMPLLAALAERGVHREAGTSTVLTVRVEHAPDPTLWRLDVRL
jgi:hypothetical protein